MLVLKQEKKQEQYLPQLQAETCHAIQQSKAKQYDCYGWYRDFSASSTSDSHVSILFNVSMRSFHPIDNEWDVGWWMLELSCFDDLETWT